MPCQVMPGAYSLEQVRAATPVGPTPPHWLAYREGEKVAKPLPCLSYHGPMCSNRRPRLRVNLLRSFQESLMKPSTVVCPMSTVGEKFVCLNESAYPRYIRAFGFMQSPRRSEEHTSELQSL